MLFEWDEAKRQETLVRRGLDFADATRVFAGRVLNVVDDRRDYRETRTQSYGLLDDNVMMIVWTWRGDRQRIISMRQANDRERRAYRQLLGS